MIGSRFLIPVIMSETIARSRAQVAGVTASLALGGCAMWSPDLAPFEPRLLTVGEGAVIATERNGPIHVERISRQGVTVSRRNGHASWQLPAAPEVRGLGNGEYLTVIDWDAAAKTARIRHSETNRRGFDGAFSF